MQGTQDRKNANNAKGHHHSSSYVCATLKHVLLKDPSVKPGGKVVGAGGFTCVGRHTGSKPR